ncbi:ATPase WRNIP1-like [Copidosoma floridanum]|uniref:ATPase WRNIP1-like n=1 Tax=Copidosoma floridanum TaxID=29053 RepID=UPI0006C942DC|nr:ATPase WRNIP1-like [Copidosoma floridanum]
MSNQEANKQNMTECPICYKTFSQNLIEAHVNKCLFLTESTSTCEASTPKRSSSFKSITENSPAAKRPKHSLSVSKSEGTLGSTYENSSPNRKFDSQESAYKKELRHQDSVPLSERMRPADIISYVGQTHVIGQDSMLYKLLTNTEIPNIILWGPPGCGKTSLAHVIENICKRCPGGKYRFVKLSAAMSGVADVKTLIATASNDLKFGRRTVIFLDEIHRFNKTQQDIFLPHIESGTVTLIGATTENPSYTMNSALLSRCRVIVLEKLSIENLTIILEQAVKTLDGSIIDKSKKKHKNSNTVARASEKFIIDREAINWLAETSDGDARIALGGLELAIERKIQNANDCQSPGCISLDDIKTSLKKSHMLYDRTGDQHYDMISALHKSVRSSDENAALYWLTRMLVSGEDPVYIARRMVRASGEDIGMEDPKALGLAVNTMQACKMLGMPECDLSLAQCVTYLARAPKSRMVDSALRAAQKYVSSFKGCQPPVPLHLRRKPQQFDFDRESKRVRISPENDSEMTYLPRQVQNANFFPQN